jgi:hypothetical protein
MKTIFLAVNKKDQNEVHSFTWLPDDQLVINGRIVDKKHWEISEFSIINSTTQQLKKP